MLSSAPSLQSLGSAALPLSSHASLRTLTSSASALATTDRDSGLLAANSSAAAAAAAATATEEDVSSIDDDGNGNASEPDPDIPPGEEQDQFDLNATDIFPAERLNNADGQDPLSRHQTSFHRDGGRIQKTIQTPRGLLVVPLPKDLQAYPVENMCSLQSDRFSHTQRFLERSEDQIVGSVFAETRQRAAHKVQQYIQHREMSEEALRAYYKEQVDREEKFVRAVVLIQRWFRYWRYFWTRRQTRRREDLQRRIRAHEEKMDTEISQEKEEERRRLANEQKEKKRRFLLEQEEKRRQRTQARPLRTASRTPTSRSELGCETPLSTVPPPAARTLDIAMNFDTSAGGSRRGSRNIAPAAAAAAAPTLASSPSSIASQIRALAQAPSQNLTLGPQATLSYPVKAKPGRTASSVARTGPAAVARPTRTSAPAATSDIFLTSADPMAMAAAAAVATLASLGETATATATAAMKLASPAPTASGVGGTTPARPSRLSHTSKASQPVPESLLHVERSSESSPGVLQYGHSLLPLPAASAPQSVANKPAPVPAPSLTALPGLPALGVTPAPAPAPAPSSRSTAWKAERLPVIISSTRPVPVDVADDGLPPLAAVPAAPLRLQSRPDLLFPAALAPKSGPRIPSQAPANGRLSAGSLTDHQGHGAVPSLHLIKLGESESFPPHVPSGSAIGHAHAFAAAAAAAAVPLSAPVDLSLAGVSTGMPRTHMSHPSRLNELAGSPHRMSHVQVQNDRALTIRGSSRQDLAALPQTFDALAVEPKPSVTVLTASTALPRKPAASSGVTRSPGPFGTARRDAPSSGSDVALAGGLLLPPGVLPSSSLGVRNSSPLHAASHVEATPATGTRSVARGSAPSSALSALHQAMNASSTPRLLGAEAEAVPSPGDGLALGVLLVSGRIRGK